MLGLSILLQSCEDVLDKKPKNLISEADVFGDKNLVDAQLAQIYQNMNFQQTGGESGYNMGLIAAYGGEARMFGDWQYKGAVTKIIDETGDGALGYWPYSSIRKTNTLIEKMKESQLEKNFRTQRSNEARFLRAYMYFEMVKRYGGVPLITEVLAMDSDSTLLFPKRSSEKEIYDFIASEVDTLVKYLPEVQSNVNYGRPTKFAALALKSRAMLYAASVAEFDTPKLDGLLGFNSSDAQKYYQMSFDASLEIINSGKFELYKKDADKAKNFQKLFYDDENNPEVIFAEQYSVATGRTHSWNYLCMPDGFRVGWGANFNVFLETVERFDYIDGTSGKIDRSKLTASERWDVATMLHNRDPRFIASVYYPGCEWQGSRVYMHSETKITEGGSVVTKKSGTIGDEEWPAAAPARNTKRTGFFLKKRVNESQQLPATNEDGTDFYVFRLGEIYLNIAESAFHLGRTSDAEYYLNEIRDRAGMPDVTISNDDAGRNTIRHERETELAFEEHRYWDLRRWRIAHLNIADGGLNTNPDGSDRYTGLKFKYDYDTKKYIIAKANAEGFTRVFMERYYYQPISLGRIADNPNLVENPGYTGAE